MSLWAIVPLKIVTGSKQRLAGVLTEQQRVTLTLAMASDVINSLTACQALDHVLLVSGDEAAADLCRDNRAQWLKPPQQEGLNADLAFACEFAHAQGGQQGLILHADLPLLRADALDTLIQQMRTACHEQDVALVPCKEGTGTNLLYAPLPLPLPLVYGKNSYLRFQDEAKQRRIQVHSLQMPQADLDVDLPADLTQLQARIAQLDCSIAPATRAALAAMQRP